MTNRYRILISGCGGAGRSVAKVATADGRGEIVGLVDPQQSQLDRMLTYGARFVNSCSGPLRWHLGHAPRMCNYIHLQ